MGFLRRRVRSAFLFAAFLSGSIVVVLIKHPDIAPVPSEWLYYSALTVNAVLVVVYGAAWVTTRKPSSYRNNWAVAASSISLVQGMVFAFIIYKAMPGDLRAEIPALGVILVSGAGLYLYAPGGSPPRPESASQTVASSKSARPMLTSAPTPFPRRTISTTPTAPAPSLIGASSSELAAAAVSPGDPSAPFDPLAFLRTPEILQKVRSES